MNFFEQQERARKQTYWLVFLYILALVAIVVPIVSIVLLVYGEPSAGNSRDLLDAKFLAHNLALIGLISFGTLITIGIFSLYRMATLKSGGGKIAVELGGLLVPNETQTSPLYRRLRNVVEEIALASGVPVPDIYVLPTESNINAFAAGYTPADAVIAVTQGTLEKLNREELQGVIAHEFSHIFNGDMRLNIRLIGLLFGITMIALSARKLLTSVRYSRNSNTTPIIMIATAILAVGYIGIFFARWIKAAVSRRREFLADASAVQFTRNPNGIAGALKRIAIEIDGSLLETDSEEISHMLFGTGHQVSLFASHPPLLDRIKRIEPKFNPVELEALARHVSHRQVVQDKERSSSKDTKNRQKGGAGIFTTDHIINNIGHPNHNQLIAAAMIVASLPTELQSAARLPDWAAETLYLLILSKDPQIRQQQISLVAQQLGVDSEKRLHMLLQIKHEITPEQRLPLAEIVFPTLKHRPRKDLLHLIDVIHTLVAADGKVSVFEYTLAKMFTMMVNDTLSSSDIKLAGRKTVKNLKTHVDDLLRIVAALGHCEQKNAAIAWQKGMHTIDLVAEEYVPGDWQQVLDTSLVKLDQLAAKQKECLLRALLATITSDNEVKLVEMELLRVICACLHIPLPMSELSPN